jgi:hypothetical protein
MAAIGPNEPNKSIPETPQDKGLVSLDRDTLKLALSYMPLPELTKMANLDGRVKQMVLNPGAKEEFNKFLQFIIDTIKDEDTKNELEQLQVAVSVKEILGFSEGQVAASLRSFRDAVVEVIKDLPELEVLKEKYNTPGNFYNKVIQLALNYSRQHAIWGGESQRYLLRTYEEEGDIEAIDKMYDLRLPDINVKNLIENPNTSGYGISAEKIVKNLIDKGWVEEALILAKKINVRFEEGTYDKSELMCRIVGYLMLKGRPDLAKDLLQIWPKEKQLEELDMTLWRVGELKRSIANIRPENRLPWYDLALSEGQKREEGVLKAKKCIEAENKDK